MLNLTVTDVLIQREGCSTETKYSEITAEVRQNSPDEQKVLTKYIGWGFKKSLFEPNKKEDDGHVNRLV